MYRREDHPPCAPCFLMHPLVVTARQGIWADVAPPSPGSHSCARRYGEARPSHHHSCNRIPPAWRTSYNPHNTLWSFGGQAGWCLNSAGAARAFPPAGLGGQTSEAVGTPELTDTPRLAVPSQLTTLHFQKANPFSPPDLPDNMAGPPATLQRHGWGCCQHANE